MSLRDAKFRDHWRHIFERQFPTRFTEIEFKQLYCLANGTVQFSGGITAIVGGNGVGKSTLVAAIVQLLSPEPNSIDPAYLHRLSGSEITGRAVNGDHQFHLHVADDADGKRVILGDTFDGEYKALDPSALASECLRQIHTDPNFRDLLEPVTALELNSQELAIASYLIGKIYTEIKIYEISDYKDFDRFPYFRVSSANVSYASENMGRGELSLLLTYWTLKDMPKGSILILEEPETHVSPRSQDSLMNVVAKFCDEKGMWTIITTHSPTVISRLPREHIKLLARNEGPAFCAGEVGKLQIALLLGGGIAYSGIVFVEDKGAKGFLQALLEKIDPELLRQIEIMIAGSESAITSIMKILSPTGRLLTIFGAYDGDMQALIDGVGFKCPFGFLPGSESPEELLQGFAHDDKALALLATELGQTEQQITVALNTVAGVDHHDFLRRLAEALGIEIITVLRGLVRAWLSIDENSKSATGFVERIKASAATE